MTMKSLITRIFTGLVILLSLSVWAPTAFAAIDCNAGNLTPSEALQCGASGAAGKQIQPKETVESISAESGSNLSTTVKKILNILSAIVGIVAIIMIIIGGFRYVTSGGKQENITAAKNTITYALIGLVIVALAQVIVHFVLREATEATTTTTTSKPKPNP